MNSSIALWVTALASLLAFEPSSSSAATKFSVKYVGIAPSGEFGAAGFQEVDDLPEDFLEENAELLKKTSSEIQALVHKMNGAVEPFHLKTPSELLLVISPASPNNFYLAKDSSMHVSAKLLDEFGWGVEGKSSSEAIRDSVWIHEYGHGILSSNLTVCVPNWEKLTLAALNLGLDLDAKSQDNKRPLAERRKFDLQNQKLGLLQLPYEELFADVVAVLETGNPEAMAEMADFGKQVSAAAAQARSFQKYPFDADQLTLERFDDPHVILAPVRTHLWSHYLSGEVYGNRETFPAGWLLKQVSKAICSEIQVNLGLFKKPGFLDPSNLNLSSTVKVLNKRLIQRIDQVFHKCPDRQACPEQ